ncbi:MAG: hypothetical protein AB2L14_19510 [Candidatus Xenobiia bacterium LiM19]
MTGRAISFTLSLILLVLMTGSVYCEDKKDKEKDVQAPVIVYPEIRNPELYRAITDIESRLYSISTSIFAFLHNHKKELAGTVKDDMKGFNESYLQAMKACPMAEKSKLKHLKGMYDEMVPLIEEIMDMSDLYLFNLEESIDKTVKSRKIIEEKLNRPIASRDDEVARKALYPVSVVDMNMLEAFTRNMSYLSLGRKDLKALAFKDRQEVSRLLLEFSKQVELLTKDPRITKEITSKVLDSVRSIQDAVEDYDRLKPKLQLFMEKLENVNKYIDTELKPSKVK